MGEHTNTIASTKTNIPTQTETQIPSISTSTPDDQSGKSLIGHLPTATFSAALAQTPTFTPTPGFPDTSASAITSPPSSMDGINTHSYVFGTGADPNIITLGPSIGGRVGWEPYPNKNSVEFELKHGAPVLAPLDMKFIGFNNRSAAYRIRSEEGRQAPYNDLELCFVSVDSDWPDMILCTYHLLSSPLLLGHYQHPKCGEANIWIGTFQAQGHLFDYFDDYVEPENPLASVCNPLIGKIVKRGEIIGYAGSVANHSMAPFRIKVPYSSKNPLVENGNKYLHWVQPSSFFYWKCYTPDVIFPSGVLAYPFECNGYQVPVEQQDVNFKYSVDE